MVNLLRFFSIRYAVKHPFRVFLSAMAVALGVALYVSSATSNRTTEMAFQRSNDRLKGNTDLHVLRGRMIGIEMDALKRIDALPGLRAAPVMQVSSTLPDFKEEGNILILGLDLQREMQFRRWDVAQGESPVIDALSFAFKDGIIITQGFAARHQLKLGSTFRIDTPTGAKAVSVGAIVKDEGPALVFGGNVAMMPIVTAQKLFARQNKADRIEVIVAGDVEDAARRLRETLGPEYLVEPPPDSNSFLDDAMARIKAFMGISVLALLVGIFIIYNSVSISVVERLKEIGTLRAIGATRKQVFGTVLIEWALVGLAGSTCGVFLGFALARALIQLTNKEVNVIVPIVHIDQIVLDPRIVANGLILGVMTTLFAAYFPARAAMKITPIEILRQGVYRIRMIANYQRLFWVGLLLILISLLIWFKPPEIQDIGLVSAVISFLGAAFALPQLSFWLAHAARPYLGRLFKLEAYLAADNISKYPQRTALTVVALAGALGMMVAAAALVRSFKVRGEHWMLTAFPFDTSVNATDLTTSLYSDATFPEELQPKIDAVEGVEFSYGVRAAFLDYNGRTAMVVAPEIDLYQRMQESRGLQNFIPPQHLPEMLAGHGIGVSENFAVRNRIKTGDSIELTTLHGPRRFQVLGMMEDYSWPQGVIFIDRRIYKQLWDDTGLTYLNIKIKEGADREKVSHEIANAIKGEYNLFMYDVEDLIKVGDDTMNQTQKLTNTQVGVAILIGFLGIVNTLLISVMQRKREIGLLRAVGMTRTQIVRMVVVESVFLALVAAVLGIGLGLVGAKWPLAIHVEQISGFRMPLAIPWSTLWIAFSCAIGIGFLAAFIPARRAARVNVLDAIGYE